jgi:hypothetical protein
MSLPPSSDDRVPPSDDERIPPSDDERIPPSEGAGASRVAGEPEPAPAGDRPTIPLPPSSEGPTIPLPPFAAPGAGVGSSAMPGAAPAAGSPTGYPPPYTADPPPAYPGSASAYPGASTYPGNYAGAPANYPGTPGNYPGTPGGPAPYGSGPRPAGGLAIAAFVVGIIAFLLGFVPFLGILLGIVAVVLGIIALVRRQRKVFAVLGIVGGSIGLLVSIAATIGWFVIVGSTLLPSAFEPSPTATASEAPAASAPVESEAGEDDPAGGASFRTLDDAEFATIVADPGASYGETVVLFGEVQQFDDATGACQLGLLVDNAQQDSWEGYETYALAYAASSEDVDSLCAEFDGVAELDHLKLSATVLGVTTIEFDDGTVEDVLTLDVQSVEQLAPLP